MRTMAKSIFLFSLLLVFAINNNLQAQTSKTETAFKEAAFIVNMHCEACKEKISKHLAYEKGVKSFSVNLDEKKVTVKYDPDKTNTETISKSLVKLGYTVSAAPTTKSCPETKTCPKSKSCCKQQ